MSTLFCSRFARDRKKSFLSAVEPVNDQVEASTLRCGRRCGVVVVLVINHDDRNDPSGIDADDHDRGRTIDDHDRAGDAAGNGPDDRTVGAWSRNDD